MRRVRILSAFFSVALFVSLLQLTGCTFIFQKGPRTEAEKVSHLKGELDELAKAKQELERRLSDEIADKEVKVEMLEKGLVVTFVAEVLFDSGKADLREDSFPKLDKLAQVLQTTVSNLNIGIEGHTDNEPIKKSSWKSNWELSSTRAISVLHYLAGRSIKPERLSATGYGEYHPVSSNDTKEGRQKNRRVEVVILPKSQKEKASE